MKRENLWAPWRISYIKNLDVEEKSNQSTSSLETKPNKCFLCEASRVDITRQHAKDQLVLHIGHTCLLMLNRFPYTNGHVMVAPKDHISDLSSMSNEQRTELMELTNLATKALQIAMNPQGINVGMNLGRCAGAGIPGHAHMHIVPRWNGDVSFMQVIADIRIIPQSLEESYDLLSESVQKVINER